MRTIQVTLLCGFHCSRRLLGKKLEQLKEVLKETFMVSQGASTWLLPLSVPRLQQQAGP